MLSNNPRAALSQSVDDAQSYSSATDRFREFEAVGENRGEMIVVVDRDYRYLMANRAYLKFRAAPREQFIGRHAREVVSPEVFEKVVKPKLDECFQNHVVKFEMTYSYPHLGERNLFISYFPIVGPTGVERVASVLQDITERKRAHELIRQERDHARGHHRAPTRGIRAAAFVGTAATGARRRATHSRARTARRRWRVR
jgi:PAS domain S-box-containing protein